MKILLLIVLHSTNAFAGGSLFGDGGYAVECLAPASEFNMLEVYEADHFYNDVPVIPTNTVSFFAPIDRVGLIQALSLELVKFKIEAPEFLEYLETEMRIELKAVLVPRTLFKLTTMDWGVVLRPMPASCFIVQAAVQRIEKESEPPVIFINESIWSRFTYTNRAALALHESLHRWFDKEKNTLAVRQVLIWYMAPEKFKHLNASVINDVIKNRRAADSTLFKSVRY
ncbi:MAG: hypothetical protein V4736_02680 [Bdellovibrionota bacterium]